LLKTLEETGLASNTIVVFTSDHGEMMGSHGVPPTTKQVPWAESALVPFLLRVPAVSARAVRTPLTTPDILPTLLGLAGVGIPASIEGEDLSPLIRSGGETDRAALYMNVSPFVRGAFGKEYRAIRTRKHTFVRGIEGPWLLFDDERDPWQINNLAGQPEHAALVKQLDGQLGACLKRIGDDFRPAAAYLREWGYRVGPHGSVPYGAADHQPQTPRRRTAAP
jgi:arylsulfatase A-like enzyme